MDATATPAVIATTVATPAPTVGAGQTASPSAITTTVALPAVTASKGQLASPATIDTPVTLYLPIVPFEGPTISPPFNFTVSVTSSVSAAPIGYGLYTSEGTPPEYKVAVLTPGGTKLGMLPDAAVTDISWILNGMGRMEFQMPVDSVNIGLLEVAEREVQVWRGPDLIWQGVVVRARGDSHTVTFQCLDLSWYFTRRYVGSSETNYIKNGDFEDGFNQWIVPHFDPSEPAANRDPANYTIELSTWSVSGSQSVKINANANLVAGAGVGQSFLWDVPADTDPELDEWFLVAWCYIPSDEYVGPRPAVYTDDGQVGNMGLHFQRASTSEVVWIQGIAYPDPIEQLMIQIDDSTPKDRWVRLQIALEVPYTGQPESIAVQAFGPIGTIYWDNISVVREEALSFNGIDQATIIETLVQHSQDPIYGKSDLRIGTQCPATGIRRARTYMFYNHELISDTIDEWPGLWQGMDWDIAITQDTRTFRSFYPQKGSYKPKYALVLGKNISNISMDRDGEGTSSSVMVFADQGDGSAREEEVVIDTTALTDGLVLELVYPATPGSAVSTLTAQAERGLRRWRNPIELPSITVTQEMNNELLGVVVPGDIVPVSVNYGWYQLEGDYRIMEISLDPKTEQMTLVVNNYANWDIV